LNFVRFFFESLCPELLIIIEWFVLRRCYWGEVAWLYIITFDSYDYRTMLSLLFLFFLIRGLFILDCRFRGKR